MIALSAWHVVTLAWVVFLVYWAVSASGTKRSVKKETVLGRLPQMVLVVLGAILVFRGDTKFAILNQRFVHKNSLALGFGIVLTWAGIAIAIWARYHIGQYWSGRVTLKEDHQLIRTGPYARTRHPIYSGIALALLGTAFVVGAWRALLGALLIISAHVLKARKEEAWLTTRFGNAYEEYRLASGFLLPRIRAVSREPNPSP